jgi:hypothetical protein
MNYELVAHGSQRSYSVLKLFTGFAIAALTAWKLMVTNAIANANTVVIAKTIQPILIR